MCTKTRVPVDVSRGASSWRGGGAQCAQRQESAAQFAASSGKHRLTSVRPFKCMGRRNQTWSWLADYCMMTDRRTAAAVVVRWLSEGGHIQAGSNEGSARKIARRKGESSKFNPCNAASLPKCKGCNCTISVRQVVRPIGSSTHVVGPDVIASSRVLDGVRPPSPLAPILDVQQRVYV